MAAMYVVIHEMCIECPLSTSQWVCVCISNTDRLHYRMDIRDVVLNLGSLRLSGADGK